MYKGTFLYRSWALAGIHYGNAIAYGYKATVKDTDSGYVLHIA